MSGGIKLNKIFETTMVKRNQIRGLLGNRLAIQLRERLSGHLFYELANELFSKLRNLLRDKALESIEDYNG